MQVTRRIETGMLQIDKTKLPKNYSSILIFSQACYRPLLALSVLGGSVSGATGDLRPGEMRFTISRRWQMCKLKRLMQGMESGHILIALELKEKIFNTSS